MYIHHLFTFRCMSIFSIFVATILFFVPSFSFASSLTNAGFETGDFTGWDVVGEAEVVESYVGKGYNNELVGPTFYPKEGSKFAVLKTGLGAGAYSTISQTKFLNTGETISGWAAFDAVDYLPYNDDAAVVVQVGGIVGLLWSKDIAAVGNYGASEWEHWSFTAPYSGLYTITLKVRNVLDNGLDSYALFDGDGGIFHNNPPTLSDLGQFKMFGEDVIAEGATFIGNTAVFKAKLDDFENDQVKLEIEVIPTTGPYVAGTNVYSSAYVESGSVAEITVDSLIPKEKHYEQGGNVQSFRWKARAIDSNSNASSWQEFGTAGNVDFTAKVVPLYTQQPSDYPSEAETDSWYDQPYAAGEGNNADDPGRCGLTIEDCGCALASIVMLAQYYDVRRDRDGKIIQPLNLNNWLLENSGYAINGNIIWSAVDRYTKNGLVYHSPHNDANNYSILEKYVADDAEQIPVIAQAMGHFFVIDSKVGNGKYTVRDPYYFETKTLNDPVNVLNRVRKYNNKFSSLRVFKQGSGSLVYTPYLTYSLGSPAELLLTDSYGRRLGKDPRTGEEFREIPGGVYYEEFIGNPVNEISFENSDPTKVLVVPNAGSGEYQLEVIGTGSGKYTLISTYSDTDGESGDSKFESITAEGNVAFYRSVYNSEDATESIIEEETIETLLIDLKESAVEIINPGIQQAVISKTNNIEDSVQKGKLENAIKSVDNLDEFVEQQVPKHISENTAQEMYGMMKKIRLLLQQ